MTGRSVRRITEQSSRPWAATLTAHMPPRGTMAKVAAADPEAAVPRAVGPPMGAAAEAARPLAAAQAAVPVPAAAVGVVRDQAPEVAVDPVRGAVPARGVVPVRG